MMLFVACPTKPCAKSESANPRRKVGMSSDSWGWDTLSVSKESARPQGSGIFFWSYLVVEVRKMVSGLGGQFIIPALG